MKPLHTNRTNYHSHSLFCDGRADMRDFVRFALSHRFSSYGFSGHAPLPFSTAWTMEWDRMDDYISEFRRLRTLYRGQIELYIGLEIDYLDASHNPASPQFAALPLDYRIGSIHMLPDIDGHWIDVDLPYDKFSLMVNEHFGGDIESLVRLYYKHSRQMLAAGGFNIVGHADKIHYNASSYRPQLTESLWYDSLVRAYFEEIAARGYQMEVNTKSYEELGVFFPDERYFSYIHALGIPVQVNSDAHDPDRIDNGRRAALEALYQAGYRFVMELHGGFWQPVPISLNGRL